MGDGFWNRQPQQQLPPPQQQQQQFQQPQQQYPPAPPYMQQHSAGMLKRSRSDYDYPPAGMPPNYEMLNYLPRDDDRGGSHIIKDNHSLGSAYDRYLQSAQPSFGSGEANYGAGDRPGRAIGGIPSLPPLGEPPMLGGPRGMGHDVAPNGRAAFGSHLPLDPMARPGPEVLPLPPDASKTIFVEGLPPDSTKREVAHIFRPFLGYKEVRLVSKESKLRGGDPLILCFVDFTTPACAATALSALQGYKMDDHESDSRSNTLRLQFARFAGPRPGSGPRGKR